MSKTEIMEKLKSAIIELDDVEVDRVLREGLDAGISPMEMIIDGLGPGLHTIGEGFQEGERFMADLVMAGDITTDAVETLRPIIEAGGNSLGENMVIGTVEGDLHTIGKRIVAATFIGAGYRVVDIGESKSADEFVRAAKELNAVVVGASACIGPVKPYCGVINNALIDAGLRDNVIYIVGGFGMSPDWSVTVGADAHGENAVDALHKVRMIRAGELPKLKDRVRK